jgi:hypothetical protein
MLESTLPMLQNILITQPLFFQYSTDTLLVGCLMLIQGMMSSSRSFLPSHTSSGSGMI